MAVFLSDEQDLEVDHEDLVALARSVLAAQGVPDDMEVAVLLVDEPTIAGLNRQHMDKEGPTDVLSFPIDEPGQSPPDVPAILGDVVICPVVAERQAPGLSRSTAAEMQVLLVHGILHLLGMDHDSPGAEHEMFSLTDRLLSAHRSGRGS